ncbi:hypothetical protein [Thiolapillus sp.]
MAERGRFPVLYWASIFLLLLMLAFTGWYFFQNSHPLCRNSVNDPVVKHQLERFWQQGRVLVLSAAQGAAAEGYLAAGPGKDYQVLKADACPSDPGALSPYAGKENRLVLLSTACFRRLLRGDEAEADLLFMVMPEAGSGKPPAVLACADLQEG